MEQNQLSLSVLTYNIHSCVGSDNLYSVDRVAKVVKEADADIVCLQEVEVNDIKEPRTTRVWSQPHRDDQPAMIATQAGYQYYKFAPAVRSIANLVTGTEVLYPVEGSEEDSAGQFGVALLSKYPILESRIIKFRPYGKKTPRNVLACLLEIPRNGDDQGPKEQVWMLSTHLGMHVRGGEQYQQAKELRLFVENLLHPPEKNNEEAPITNNTVLLAGDFNSASWYKSIKELKKVLIEANRHNEGTFPAVGSWWLRSGTLKLDYIFHSPNVICTDTKVQKNDKVASDHLAYSASFLISSI